MKKSQKYGFISHILLFLSLFIIIFIMFHVDILKILNAPFLQKIANSIIVFITDFVLYIKNVLG